MSHDHTGSASASVKLLSFLLLTEDFYPGNSPYVVAPVLLQQRRQNFTLRLVREFLRGWLGDCPGQLRAQAGSARKNDAHGCHLAGPDWSCFLYNILSAPGDRDEISCFTHANQTSICIYWFEKTVPNHQKIPGRFQGAYKSNFNTLTKNDSIITAFFNVLTLKLIPYSTVYTPSLIKAGRAYGPYWTAANGL